VLKFTGDQVEPGTTFNIFNCEKTKIVIEGRCKNVMLSRCKKVDITIDETVSGMEVIKSEQMKVRIVKAVKNISVELC
jgi:adenylyl cyclase-associated protein